MKRLNFYFKYAWRSVIRGGQRSFFAILCVAVGVASLVALQSLGQSIADTLTGDAKGRAGGDVIAQVTTGTNPALQNAAATELNQLKSNGLLTDWTGIVTNSPQFSGYFGFPPTVYSVDPTKYPLYGDLKILEPAGKSLRELISAPNTIVISKNLWEKQKYQLGQEIELRGDQSNGGKTSKVKIVGQASADIPGIVFGPGQFFGFGFTSLDTAKGFLDDSSLNPNTVFIKTPIAQRLKENLLTIRGPSSNLQENRRPYLFNQVLTVQEQQEQITRGLNVTQDLLSYVGLLSLLIGGIGVINTMLVVIGRRTTEIATVKALGLKTRQTLFIFTLEAVVLGVIGSVAGVILGEFLGLLIKGTAEGFFARPLNWGFYIGPVIIGLIVGILTSAVFGFLPSYAASRVRPGVVLRMQSGALPSIGGWASFLIIMLMTLAFGIIAGVLLNNMVVGIIVAFATLVVSAIMVGVMWIIVFLVGKLPAPFGPSVKMALRSFSRHRGRTASTVLVMVGGLFFISFIVIIADSIKTTIRDTFDLDLGYNVVAFNPFPSQTEETKATLQREIPGLQKLFIGNGQGVTLLAINGVSTEIAATPPTNGTPPPTPSQNQGNNFRNQPRYPGITLSGRDFINGDAPGASGKQQILSGRNLIPSDVETNGMLVRSDAATEYKLKVGDKVTVRSNPQRGILGGTSSQAKTLEMQVVGILDKGNSTVNFEQPWIASFKTVSDLGAQFSLYYLLVDRAQIKPALEKVQNTVGFVIDLGDLIDTFSKLLDQFLAFPLLLSLLSLFSGAILIANNVALAMLERRTEIGVLKAIGAKQQRIMRILLWESGLVGLLGGLIGVGMGVLIALNVTRLTGSTNSALNVTWSPLTALLLIALGIGLAIGATLASAWGAVQEKPLVVLRYE